MSLLTTSSSGVWEDSFAPAPTAVPAPAGVAELDVVVVSETLVLAALEEVGS